MSSSVCGTAQAVQGNRAYESILGQTRHTLAECVIYTPVGEGREDMMKTQRHTGLQLFSYRNLSKITEDEGNRMLG